MGTPGVVGRVPRGLVVAVFIACLLLSGTWALSTPLMAVPDEATHTIRAVSLWQGDLIGNRTEFRVEGPPLVLATQFEVTAPAGYALVPQLTTCFDGLKGPAGCQQDLVAAPGTITMGTIAGVYPPLPYLVYGAPSRVLPPTQALYAGRLAGAVLTAALLAGAAACAWLVGGRRAVGLTALALTPVAAFLGGAINPNGLEIAGALALWTGVPALLRSPERRWVAGVVTGAALAVAWSRPLSSVMVVGIVAVSLVAMTGPGQIAGLWSARPARAAVLGTAAAVATSAVWVLATGALDTFIATPDPSLTPGVAASGSWDMTGLRLRQMVGYFGINDAIAPDPLWQAWTAAGLVLVLAALACGTWRQIIAIAALIAATLLLPVLAEATTAAELGYTWQGRYTLPVAVGVVVCSAWAVAGGRHRLPARVLDALLAVVGLAVVFGHVLGHLTSMARFSTGPGTGLLTYLGAPGWSPPGPDVLLLVAAAAGAVLLVAAPLLGRDRGPAPADATDGWLPPSGSAAPRPTRS